ncbi:MAG: preprotein translocase subunit YajC [Candidatus Omnitrophica bacterium]|nr:preprotein translocase subunit YajC [Candidatus Omnitrophota bacterium]
MNLFSNFIPAQAAPAASQGGGNMLVSFMPLVLMFVIFYFLLIRPQQKRQKAHQNMLKTLKKGDRVVTSGGLMGTVWGVAEDKVVLKVGEDEVKLEFEKSAIATLVKAKE